MKVTPPLSASLTQTYVGARYLRSGDTIWDLPTKNVTGMLHEHGLKDGERVVTPAVSRNDDDDDEEEASAEEHRDTPTHCWQVSVPGSRQTRHCIRLARSVAKLVKSDIIASKRLRRYLCGTMALGLKLQEQNRACSTLTVFSDSDWSGDRPTRKSVSSWVIMLDGFLLSAGARTQAVVAQSSCEAEYIAATAATSEAKYIQDLFLSCGRSDSSGAIVVASRRGLQRLLHLDVRFLCLQQETANNKVRISKVPCSVNVADSNTKPADKSSLELC